MKRILNDSIRFVNDFLNWCLYKKSFFILRLVLLISPLITFCFNPVKNIFPIYYFDIVKEANIEISGNYFNVLNNLSLDYLLIIYITIIIHILLLRGYLIFFLWPIKIWISYSFQNLAPIIEGGDQINYIFSILYFLYYLSEILYRKKISLLFYFQDSENFILNNYKNNFLFNVILIIIKSQISIIYLHSVLEKLKSSYWIDGSAIFYINQGNLFGENKLLVQNYFLHKFPILISITNYSVLIIEFLIGVIFLIQKKQRKKIVILGIILHLIIAINFGLTLFSVMMICLILFSASNIKINDKYF